MKFSYFPAKMEILDGLLLPENEKVGEKDEQHAQKEHQDTTDEVGEMRIFGADSMEFLISEKCKVKLPIYKICIAKKQ